ncbi:hypothetical protein H4582DRAFT_2068947 [Lactarius indigo]|nr:hypothetical protein H4582DRAFT_2068947 [Lactarius indigo]
MLTRPLLLAHAITGRILSAPWFSQAATISCYLSMPMGEVDTSAITESNSGIWEGTSSFPRWMLRYPGGWTSSGFTTKRTLHSLPDGVWGIKEPQFQYRDAPRMKATDEDGAPLDVILIPGVAFDRSLARLGHGKGYYDRFLTSYTSLASTRGSAKPLFVGLALREQVLAAGDVPVGANDVQVDMVVTPDETITLHHV